MLAILTDKSVYNDSFTLLRSGSNPGRMIDILKLDDLAALQLETEIKMGFSFVEIMPNIWTTDMSSVICIGIAIVLLLG